MRASIERAIAEHGQTQYGLITRLQYRELGLSDSSIRRRTLDGRHEQFGRRTFRLPGAPTDARARLRAACLDCNAVASHRSAAWLHGLRGFAEPAAIEVVVAKGRTRAVSELAIIRQTTSLPIDDIVLVDQIPCTSVARTILGLSALVPDAVGRHHVVDAVESAVREHKASDRWLWWLLEERRCRGRNGTAVMEDVLAERAELGPTESWLERETLLVLARAGLPAPVVQRRITDGGRFISRVDLAYPAARVAIEVEGKEHLSPEQHALDARQRNELQLLGFTILTFTYHDVVSRPDQVVRTVRQALQLSAVAA